MAFAIVDGFIRDREFYDSNKHWLHLELINMHSQCLCWKSFINKNNETTNTILDYRAFLNNKQKHPNTNILFSHIVKFDLNDVDFDVVINLPEIKVSEVNDFQYYTCVNILPRYIISFNLEQFCSRFLSFKAPLREILDFYHKSMTVNYAVKNLFKRYFCEIANVEYEDELYLKMITDSQGKIMLKCEFQMFNGEFDSMLQFIRENNKCSGKKKISFLEELKNKMHAFYNLIMQFTREAVNLLLLLLLFNIYDKSLYIASKGAFIPQLKDIYKL